MAQPRRPDDGIFLGLRLSPSLRRRLEVTAEKTGQTYSAVVRQALEASLLEEVPAV